MASLSYLWWSWNETIKYGLEEDVPKDALTHETYWKKMWFEYPCTEEDKKEFPLVNPLCRLEEHKKKLMLVPWGLIAQINYVML